jgi:nitrite reductase (NADH) small subunit
VRAVEPDEAGRVVVCRADDLRDGERCLIKVGRRRIGVFRVDGRFFALHGTCPHAGGALCEGPLTGTTLPTDDFFTYEYGRDGRILRCAWHGWEFDIETGRSLVDPDRRARTYRVHVDNGAVVVDLRS